MTIDDIYKFLEAIAKTIEYNTGGQQVLIKRIDEGTASLTRNVPMLIDNAVITMQGHVADVGYAVDYARDFVVDKLSKKIDGIKGTDDKSIDELKAMITTSQKEVQKSISASTDTITSQFTGVASAIDRLSGKLESSLTAMVKNIVEGLGDKLTALTNSSNKVVEANTKALETLEKTLNTKLSSIDNRIDNGFNGLITAITNANDKLIRREEDLHKGIAQENIKALGEVKDAIKGLEAPITASGLAVAGSVSTGITALIATLTAESASDKLQWAPLIAAGIAFFTTFTSFWDQVIGPLSKDPEGTIADLLSTVTELYYNVGRRTYDKMGLGGGS